METKVAQRNDAVPSPSSSLGRPDLAAGADREARGRSGLRPRAIVMSLLLLVQFFLGMITNLYVTIPAHHPGANPNNFFVGAARSVAWAISDSSLGLAMHATLGCCLIVAAIEFIIAASRRRNVLWIWTSSAGACFLTGAAFNGAAFLAFNQQNYRSLIMAGLFALGLGSYLLGIYLDGRQAWRQVQVRSSAGS
jgi:hypothetical protein